jgi:hypothetical protein
MRSLRYTLCFSFLATLLHAQGANQTDAQHDDLAGPVKSVLTNVQNSGVNWNYPGGPLLLVPIWCGACDYDPDGSKTKSGNMMEGKFYGETIQLARDGNGNVTERYVRNSIVKGLSRYDRVGPFGNTEQTSYQGGKVFSRGLFNYDRYGHMSEALSFDAEGNSMGRTEWKRLPDGTVTEQSTYGNAGELQWQQSYDPETTQERFATYDEVGKANLTWTVLDGKPTSFWDGSNTPSPFGDSFSEDVDKNNLDHYVCHKDGTCERFRIHCEYLDPNKRNMRSGEWRDAQGKLMYGVYYEYEIDSFRNWTRRQVWVFTPDLGERTLYETDSRKNTYWEK